MQPGYHYLAGNDGHRSILGVSTAPWEEIMERLFTLDQVEPITDPAVLAYLNGE